jgi:hypothetical protein
MLLSKLSHKIATKIDSITLQKKILSVYKNTEKPKSAIFYTTHKCASSFVPQLFSVILKNSDYELVDYAGAIWHLGNKFNLGTPHMDCLQNFLEKSYSDLYSLHGRIYGPQRVPLDFPGRDKFKNIFFLRDPRDVLISAYFSFAFTHPEPLNNISRKEFLKRRNRLHQQGIDQYVLEEAKQWIVPLYSQYKHLRETAPDYIYLKYDFFKNQTPDFIRAIADFLVLLPTQEDIELLTKQASPVQTTEVMKHQRSGKNGQYLDKLHPETVEKLNDILAEVLSDWKFNV